MKKPFRGRVHPPQTQEPSVALPCRRLAFVYQRLSTTEQKKNSTYSLERQDDLARLARQDGYPEQLIYVERRDLGLSGTLGQAERPGLAFLIRNIEQDQVESIYVIEISRISRDQTLLDGYQFGELCKAHGVIIVTPDIRLNLRDELHMRMYRYMLDHAAEELKTLRFRFQSAKEMKARHGYYTSGSIPPGYILDTRSELEDGTPNPNAQKFLPYEPHARVIRLLFQELAKSGTTIKSVALWSQQEQIVLPPFPEALSRTKVNLLGFARSRSNADGSYPITVSRLGSIVHNPAYIGWFIWGGQVLARDNHPAIIDEKTFWRVQEKFNHKKTLPLHAPRPLLLSRLLECGMHQPARRITSSNSAKGAHSFYRCANENEAQSCLHLNAHILDIAVETLVLSQCSFAGYADRVIESLMADQERAKAEQAAAEREYLRLEKEIETLKANLAATRTPEQVDTLLQRIESNLHQKAQLAQQDSSPLGRVLSAVEVKTIRDFLTNLDTQWAALTTELKNTFLTLLLERITVRQTSGHITARIVWRTGMRQEIRISTDQLERIHRWTNEEKRFLSEYYHRLSPETLCQNLRGRTWRSIQKQAALLGITAMEKKRNSRRDIKPFTTAEDEILRVGFQDSLSELELLARLPGRSPVTIQRRARQLGLVKQHIVQWEFVTLDWQNRNLDAADQDTVTTSPISPGKSETFHNLATFIRTVEN